MFERLEAWKQTNTGRLAWYAIEVGLVTGALLFVRLAGRRMGLERVRDVFALVVCAIVGTLVSASFGVVSLRLSHVIPHGGGTRICAEIPCR